MVIGGIDDVFNRHAESATGRKPRSLSYCRPAIEHAWSERRRLLAAGGSGETREPDAVAPVPAPTLRRLQAAIGQTLSSLDAIASRIPAGEQAAIDQVREDLSRIAEDAGRPDDAAAARIEPILLRCDEIISRCVVSAAPEAAVTETADAVEQRLRTHRPHMTAPAYRLTFDRAVENRLREKFSLPRLALILLLD